MPISTAGDASSSAEASKGSPQPADDATRLRTSECTHQLNERPNRKTKSVEHQQKADEHHRHQVGAFETFRLEKEIAVCTHGSGHKSVDTVIICCWSKELEESEVHGTSFGSLRRNEQSKVMVASHVVSAPALSDLEILHKV